MRGQVRDRLRTVRWLLHREYVVGEARCPPLSAAHTPHSSDLAGDIEGDLLVRVVARLREHQGFRVEYAIVAAVGPLEPERTLRDCCSGSVQKRQARPVGAAEHTQVSRSR